MSENKVSSDFISQLLMLIASHDVSSGIFWNTSLQFFVICNDLFWWGCADLEEVTPDTFHVLEKALMDGGDDGLFLYCARMRSMRPQGAIYQSLKKENWSLFDACGPEREIDIGNPL